MSVGRFLSLHLYIIGFGENPTCTRPSTSKIFINPMPFGDNMTDSIIEKIRKAAEARDKAIIEEAKRGVCAPCGELLAECLCDAYKAMASEE